MFSGDLAEIYERAFRGLVWRLRPRHLQREVEHLLRETRRLESTGIAPEEALQQVYQRSTRTVWHWLLRSARRAKAGAGSARHRAEQRRVPPLYRRGLPQRPFDPSPDFHCDAAMGGLARWLRGAGYDAAWWPGIADDALLGKALTSSAILLTTDSRLMRRGVIAGGLIPAVLVPNTLTKRGQFAWLVARLALPRKAARCMACGGRLSKADKEALRERIPPRTYAWLDEYFICERCQRLYWNGTHWPRIDARLSDAARAAVARGDGPA